MPIQNSTVSSGTITQFSGKEKSTQGNGVVYSVVLDETHPLIKKGNQKETATELIGCIEFRYTGATTVSEEQLPVAYPYDKNLKNLPLRNETVEIIMGQQGQPMYRRIGAEASPNLNVDPEYIKKNYSPKSNTSDTDKNSNYQRVENTGITSTNKDTSAKYDGFGSYFSSQSGIHKLKLYEGDMLLESRFGQSIRFSGYNNDKNEFSPTIIIRNGETRK